MRVLKPGKPWSTEVTCRGCTSILKITGDTLEFRDVKFAEFGIGFTCTVCDSKEIITIEIPPAVDELVKKRRGIAPKKPEVVKKAQPKNFNMLCGNCEAELLIEPQDIQLMPPDSYRTSCAACLNIIEIPKKNVPEEVREMLESEVIKKAKAEVLFDESDPELSVPTIVVK
jgi:transcription elongation factor Elf1